MNIDFEDRRIQMLLAGIIFFFMTFFINTDATFECTSPWKYCLLKTKNIYGIESTHKSLIAKHIDHIIIDSYSVRRGSKYNRRTETKYQLSIVSKNGSVKKVFDNYSRYEYANKTGEIWKFMYRACRLK